VIHKFPDPIYWDSLKETFEQNMQKQREIISRNPADKHTHESAVVGRNFALLFPAIAAYKDNNAKELLLSFMNEPLDTTILAWKNFQKRTIKWLRDALTSVQDEICFYLDLMHICAKNGKITLPLLKRVIACDKSMGLAWICDLRTPVVVPEKESTEEDYMESEDDTTAKRLEWIFDQIIFHQTPNKIDVICHYTINANYKTCLVTNVYAVKFKEDSRIQKALFYQLTSKKHNIIIKEATKALLSFNDRAIDTKIQKIINKRKKRKRF